MCRTLVDARRISDSEDKNKTAKSKRQGSSSHRRNYQQEREYNVDYVQSGNCRRDNPLDDVLGSSPESAAGRGRTVAAPALFPNLCSSISIAYSGANVSAGPIRVAARHDAR